MGGLETASENYAAQGRSFLSIGQDEGKSVDRGEILASISESENQHLAV
jgi:hypothetical protein